MLNIVFASCNNYFPFLSIALISLLENNSKDFDCINVYILDNGINEKNKHKLISNCEKYPCRLTFIPLNIYELLDDSTIPMENELISNSLVTYSRLFIPTFLPKDITKVIYLDCDSLILGSFKNLWNTDINDYYCAGVLEPVVNETLKKSFWFFNVENYINAGFLFINLEKWRKDNVEDEFLKFLSKHQGKYFCADQGVINKIFKDKIKIIEPKYNLIGAFQYYDYNRAKKLDAIKKEYYTKEIVNDSQLNPIFVHFTIKNDSAPWFNKEHKFAVDFKKYAKISDFDYIIKYKNDLIPQPKKFIKKTCENISKILLIFVPSKIMCYRVNKKRLKLFKSEELRARKYCSD